MTNNPFYTRHLYNYALRQGEHRDVTKDVPVEVRFCHRGTEVTLDGEAAAVMAVFPATVMVRLHESQECVRIPGDTVVTPVDYDPVINRALPVVGQLVEVRSGEDQGRLGIVFQEGLNATRVAFPGSRNRNHKFAARNLIIRKDLDIVAS